MSDPNTDALLRAEGAAALLGLSKGQFLRLVRCELLPTPIRLSPRKCRWLQSQLEDAARKLGWVPGERWRRLPRNTIATAEGRA